MVPCLRYRWNNLDIALPWERMPQHSAFGLSILESTNKWVRVSHRGGDHAGLEYSLRTQVRRSIVDAIAPVQRP